MMIASTAFSAVSSIQQGEQQSDYYDYQARQAEADAQASREQGQVNADKVRRAGRAQQSEARAALSASGVEVGAGTPVKIVQQIARNAEEDARQQLLVGNRQADNLEGDANLYDMAGSNARSAGYTRAGGSLIEGGYGLAKGWKSAAKPGVVSIGGG